MKSQFVPGFSAFVIALVLCGCPSTSQDVRNTSLSEADRSILQKGRTDIQDLISKGKQYEAIQRYRGLWQKNSDESAYYYLYGFALKNKKAKWGIFDKCLRRDPNFYWCLIGRGNIYAYWKVWDRANKDFDLADKALPNQPEPLLGKAEIAFARKRNDKAIGLYKSVLSKQPENRDAILGLAVLYERTRQNKKAIEWYLKHLKKEPNHFQSLRSIGQLYSQEKNLSEATIHWENALKIRPKVFRLHIQLAQAYETLSQPSRALKLYERASRLPQVHFKTYFRLGVLRADVGNIDGAIEALNNALKLDREHDETLYKIGSLYLQKGEIDKATSMLRKSVRINNKRIEARQDLAKALVQKKNYADALRQYQEILDRQPNNSKTRRAMKKLLNRLGLSERKTRGSSVTQVLKRCKTIIYRCYKTRLKEKPKLRGKLVVKLTIPKDQPVRVSWDLEKSTISDPLIQTCVKWTLQRAEFPRKGIKITYDFSFRP